MNANTWFGETMNFDLYSSS